MITEHHLIWIELDTIRDLTIGKASYAFSCKNNTRHRISPSALHNFKILHLFQ